MEMFYQSNIGDVKMYTLIKITLTMYEPKIMIHESMHK